MEEKKLFFYLRKDDLMQNVDIVQETSTLFAIVHHTTNWLKVHFY